MIYLIKHIAFNTYYNNIHKKNNSKYILMVNLKIFATVFPKSSDPFYIVGYYIKWVTSSWTHSIYDY